MNSKFLFLVVLTISGFLQISTAQASKSYYGVTREARLQRGAWAPINRNTANCFVELSRNLDGTYEVEAKTEGLFGQKFIFHNATKTPNGSIYCSDSRVGGMYVNVRFFDDAPSSLVVGPLRKPTLFDYVKPSEILLGKPMIDCLNLSAQ
jgi:hypothetical protein